MAEAANQQGNAFYKEGKYSKAITYFRKASELDHKESKYMSNLSAVLYESGDYASAIESIYLAWQRLKVQHEDIPMLDPLALKLATRMAKAKINGHANNTVPSHGSQTVAGDKKLLDASINSFVVGERPDSEDSKVKEMKTAWKQWTTIHDACSRHSAKECKATITAAKTSLRALPILKSASDPTLEYFTFGHDEVQSFMNGINGDSWDDYSLDHPKHQSQTDWSFLFGGSGDGRHVFGTLLHLSDMANESGDGSQTDNLNIHMTLVDIHPASLARLIIVLALLRQILHTRLNKDKERRIELYATLFYVYSSMLMPDYCRTIVMETSKSLLDELPRGIHGLSKCLYMHEGSLPAILDVLRYWSTPLNKSTKIFLKRNAAAVADFESMKGSIAAMIGLPTQQESMSESHFKQNKTKKISSMTPMDAYDDPEAETAIFKRTRILLPPKPLLLRHPALAELVKAYKSAPDGLYETVKGEIEQNWQPNPTLFDKISTEHCNLADHGGYPGVLTNPFDSFASYIKVTKEFERGKGPAFCRGTTGFAVTTRFFDMVADAIWELQNTLKVEVVVSDVITGTPKLLAGDLGPRPKNFPRKYSRMWLSNVPDYTHGFLNTAVHLVPHLEKGQLAMANNLLNTGSWSNISHVCYNYTLLLPRDVPRILGCEVINPQSSAWDDMALKHLPLPRPLDHLASKKELHDWLSHLLLCILCNGIPQPPPSRIDLPSNLGAFFHVLVHLHRVGFPSHWIGDFIQSVFSDTLITGAEPYLGRLPIPMSEANKKGVLRKIHLKAWQAELQVILSSTKAALPFSVAVPPEFPTADDIRVYTATVQPIDLAKHRFFRYWAPLASPFTKAVGLLFYQPHEDFDAEQLAHHVSSILEAKNDLDQVNAQIMLSQEHVNLAQGKVSWKMSTQWYNKMKSEKWKMAVYRTDITVAVTKPLALSECKEILR